MPQPASWTLFLRSGFVPGGITLAPPPVASPPLFEFSKQLLRLLLKFGDALVALCGLLSQLLLKLGDALVALRGLLSQLLLKLGDALVALCSLLPQPLFKLGDALVALGQLLLQAPLPRPQREHAPSWASPSCRSKFSSARLTETRDTTSPPRVGQGALRRN
jgi:hypothetical protein